MVDAESGRWISLLKEASRATGGLHLNLHAWTIPVYYADAFTPRVRLLPGLLSCPLSQGHVKTSEARLRDGDPRLLAPGMHPSVARGVPIPLDAMPDGQLDAHLTVVEVDEGRVYDLWNCHRDPDGTWRSNAAIAYDLHGEGLFSADDIAGIRNDESVHFYGPCRASGVPALAGLIMREEVEAGIIGHKLALACPVAGLQRRVCPPAIWTDGWMPGGVPEGCCLQLDPSLDLDRLPLSREARVVARALQTHGAVLVDNAGSVTLYGEWLPRADGEKSWAGLLGEGDLTGLPLERFRVLDTSGQLREGGSHPVFHHEMAPLFYAHLKKHGTGVLSSVEPWRAGLPGIPTGDGAAGT